MAPKLRPLFFPALVLALFAVSPAGAVIDNQERDNCQTDWVGCESNCTQKAIECGKPGSKGHNSCYSDCKKICDLKKSDCLADADKDAPKPAKTKVQPSVKPGGAEVPETERPNVRPKGGIQGN